MTEFQTGIINATKRLVGHSIFTLAVIFFIGHVVIAMAVVSLITGASIWEAGLVALVEPAINSIWFYILHKIFTNINAKEA